MHLFVYVRFLLCLFYAYIMFRFVSMLPLVSTMFLLRLFYVSFRFVCVSFMFICVSFRFCLTMFRLYIFDRSFRVLYVPVMLISVPFRLCCKYVYFMFRVCVRSV